MLKKNLLKLLMCIVLAVPSHAWAYMVPDTGDLDEPVCNLRSFTDLGNGIVRDTITGLEWQQTPELTQNTWFAATTYCESLNLGGHADWRLPTVQELVTLIDHGRYNPAIAPIFDMKPAPFYFWSSAARKQNSGYAWFVDFKYGYVNSTLNTGTLYVRAVRGEPYGPLAAFVINADGTVSDPDTGLMWQQCNYGQTWNGEQCTDLAGLGTWDQASAYIEALNDATHQGYNNWRLPTRNELQTLVDYSLYNPATTFPDTEATTEIDYYWSSTAHRYIDDSAWQTRFIDGFVSAFDDYTLAYVRAVRGGVCTASPGECNDDSDCNEGYGCLETACVQPCDSDDDCNDELFCNGVEVCTEGLCEAGKNPDCDDYCDEASDQCVECLKDKHCPKGFSCLDGSCDLGAPILINKCSVKAGKTTGADSITFSGLSEATEDDFIAAPGNNVVVTLAADSIADTAETTYTFPINADSLRNGKYTSPKNKADKNAPAKSFMLDTNNGKLKFSAKNVDLTGLRCPITITVQIGDYTPQTELDEEIVNGKKPCPLPLMMGVLDSLDYNKKAKIKKKAEEASDSIVIAGSFTVNGAFEMVDPVIITLGTDSFEIPANEFYEKKGAYSCKNYDNNNGLITAKFDPVKCTYSIKIKKTTVSDSGDVDFRIEISGSLLQAPTKIPVPPDA